MFKRPAIPWLLGAAGLLAACSPLPTNDQVAPPTEGEFAPPAAEQGADLFSDDATYKDVPTSTTFKPTLDFQVSSLKHGDSPSVTTSIYQTKNELEVRQTKTVIEHAAFRFDKLEVGQEIGTGKMEVGTPPKLTLDVSVKVSSTDKQSSAIFSVKASSIIGSVYVADLRIAQVNGGLSITSIGNATRANDKQGIHTTEVSARVTQTIAPGFVVLPDAAGPMRTRTVITSEADPTDQVSGQKVFRQTYTVE